MQLRYSDMHSTADNRQNVTPKPWITHFIGLSSPLSFFSLLPTYSWWTIVRAILGLTIHFFILRYINMSYKGTVFTVLLNTFLNVLFCDRLQPCYPDHIYFCLENKLMLLEILLLFQRCFHTLGVLMLKSANLSTGDTAEDRDFRKSCYK